MTLGLEQGQRCIDKEPAKITAPSSTMLELMLTILFCYKKKNQLIDMLSFLEVMKIYLQLYENSDP